MISSLVLFNLNGLHRHTSGWFCQILNLCSVTCITPKGSLSCKRTESYLSKRALNCFSDLQTNLYKQTGHVQLVGSQICPALEHSEVGPFLEIVFVVLT